MFPCKYILLAFLFINTFCLHKCDRGLRATDDCTELRRMFIQKGLNISVPPTAVSGLDLTVCQRSYSCCTPEIEAKLYGESVVDFERKVIDKSMLMKANYEKKHKQFNDFFKGLISDAKRQFNLLFEATYDEKYRQNALIFMKLFEDLQSYYEGASLDIGSIFDDFFAVVLQRVFQLLHPSFEIDDDYNKCLAANIKNIRPFGDTPEILTSQVRRAFIGARTFVTGLEKGKQVASEVTKVYPTTDCAKGLIKMSYCSKCQGYMLLKPCHNMCLNVMKGCMCDISGMNSPWNKYISHMSMLLDRIEGPFNIAMVLEQMDIKISSAIMAPQDNQKKFRLDVFKHCGKLESDGVAGQSMNYNFLQTSTNFQPTYEDLRFSNPRDVGEEHSSKSKRSTDEDFDTFNPTNPKSRRNRNNKRERSPFQHKTSLQRLKKLAKGMKEVLLASKNYWKELPTAVCEEEAEDSESCWNGEIRGRYSKEVTQDGIENQANNPEVRVNADRHSDILIRQQISLIIDITEDLKLAYRGIDPAAVDVTLDLPFSDDEDFAVSGDYSGEGSGEEQTTKRNQGITNIRIDASSPGGDALSISTNKISIFVISLLSYFYIVC